MGQNSDKIELQPPANSASDSNRDASAAKLAAEAFVSGARSSLVAPAEAVAELYDHAAGTHIADSIASAAGKPVATEGKLAWAASQLGSAVGMTPWMWLLHRGASSGLQSLTGVESLSAMQRIGVSASSGTVYGLALTPTGSADQNWGVHRLENGIATGLSFGTLNAGAEWLGARGITNRAVSGVISGIPAGLVDTESRYAMGQSDNANPLPTMLGYSFVGGVFGLVPPFGRAPLETPQEKAPATINEFGDAYLQTTGRHGPDISAQRADDLDRHALEHVHALVQERSATGTPVRVLDLGGGTGGQSKRFAQQGAAVTLVDLGDQHKNIAAFNSSSSLDHPVNFIQQDMSKLDVGSLSSTPFDVIYSQRAIQYLHFQDAGQLLSQLLQANPKAKLFISAVGLAADDGVGYADASKPVEERFAPLRTDLAHKINAYEPMALYTAADFEKLLQQSGAENINVWLSPSGNVKATASSPERSSERQSTDEQSPMLPESEFVKRFQDLQHTVVATTDAVAQSVRPGDTELEIAQRLQSQLADDGFKDHWYPILINSGRNSGLPLSRRFHLPDSNVKVRNNDIVIVDSTPSKGTVWGNWSKTIAVGDDPFYHQLSADADKVAQQTLEYARISAKTIGDVYDFCTRLMKDMHLVSLDPRDDVGHSIFQVPVGQTVELTPLEQRLFISNEYRNSPLHGIISIEPQVGRINPEDGVMYGAKQQRVLIKD